MANYKYRYISTARTLQVKTGRGVLHTIVVGTTGAGAITITDGTDNNDTILGVLKTSIAEGTYTFDCTFLKGLRIKTDAASKITVTYE